MGERQSLIDPEFLIKTLDLKKAKVVGYNLMACCPFHKENRPSFGISIVHGRWRCFSCSEKGRKLDTLYFKLSKSVPLIYRTLSGEAAKIVTDAVVEYEIDQNWLEFLSANSEGALKCLRGMGKKLLTLDTVKKYKVGYAESKNIVHFPIIVKDDLIAFLERNPDWPERYRIKPPGMKREKLLFGFDIALANGDTAILVEGPTDVLMLSQAGHNNGIALCGSVVFNKQVDMIVKYFNKVLIFPDNDERGVEFYNQAIKKFSKRMRYLYSAKVIGYKDIGDSSIQAINTAIKKSKFVI
jgi:DNA primase